MPTSSRGLLIAAVGMIAGTPDALVLRLAIATGASLRVVLFWRFVTTCFFYCAAFSNGTMSLALKHQLAYRDILLCELPAALILEDDSVLPGDLWARLADFEVPSDAQVAVRRRPSLSRRPRDALLPWPGHVVPQCAKDAPALRARARA